jgi:hypothetical protein
MRVLGEATLLMDLIWCFVVFMTGMRVRQPLQKGLNNVMEISPGMRTVAPVLDFCWERLSRGPTPCNRRSDL